MKAIVHEVFEHYRLLTEFERDVVRKIVARNPDTWIKMSAMEKKRFRVLHRRAVARLKVELAARRRT